MIFKTLELENIRSFRKADIKFSMGTSLFEGDIGSGKSTILMAIEFALFGLGNQKGGSLLRKRANQGSVIFKFETNNKKCEVRRNLIRKDNKGPVRQGKGYLIINGTRWHLSPTEIKEKILEVLNFNEPLNPRAQSVIFRYAVYTPQEEMGYIISQKPDERLQTLRKAFGIEDYKIAAENATTISHKLKNKIIYLEGQTADLPEKKDKLKNSIQKKEGYDLDLIEVIKDGEKYQNELEIQQKKLRELEKSEYYIKEIKAQIPHLKKQIADKDQLVTKYLEEIGDLKEENNSKLLNKIKELEKLERPTSESEESLKKKKSYLQKFVNKRNELTVKLSIIKDNKVNVESKLDEQKDKKLTDAEQDKKLLMFQINEQNNLIANKENYIKKISRDKSRLEGKKQSIEDKLMNLDKLGDLCPICGSNLTYEHKKNLKTERKNKIDSLNNKILELNDDETQNIEKLKCLRTELRDLEKKIDNLKFVMEKIREIDELNNKLDSIKIDIKNLDSNIVLIIETLPDFEKFEDYINYFEELLNKTKKFNENLKDLENIKHQFEKNKIKIKENEDEICQINTDLSVLKGDLSKFEQESKKLQNILDKTQKAKSSYEELDKIFQSIKEKIISTKTLIKSLSNDIEGIQNEIEEKKELKKQYNNLYEYHLWLNDYFIPTLSLIEKHVMNENHKRFNAEFQKWFDLLMDDSTKTGKINEDFTPIIEQDGFEQEINYLSGGEKTSVALAYRLALNNIVKTASSGMESNLLILDEPTDGFSKEQLYKVRDILNELNCPQIILVSHERELESFADNIFRVEKVDGTSQVIPME